MKKFNDVSYQFLEVFDFEFDQIKQFFVVESSDKEGVGSLLGVRTN